MKLSLISLVLPLTLIGCAGTFGAAPPAPKPVPVDVAPPAAVGIAIDRPVWSMTLPDGWIVRPGGPKTMGSATQAFVARSIDKVGAAPVIVAGIEIKLGEADDPKEEDFGGVAVMVALKSGGDVITAVPTKVDGKPGSVAMIAMPGGMLVVQQAVGHKQTGIVVRCGGDLTQGDKILDRCQAILSTFSLKK